MPKHGFIECATHTVHVSSIVTSFCSGGKRANDANRGPCSQLVHVQVSQIYTQKNKINTNKPDVLNIFNFYLFQTLKKVLNFKKCLLILSTCDIENLNFVYYCFCRTDLWTNIFGYSNLTLLTKEDQHCHNISTNNHKQL